MRVEGQQLESHLGTLEPGLQRLVVRTQIAAPKGRGPLAFTFKPLLVESRSMDHAFSNGGSACRRRWGHACTVPRDGRSPRRPCARRCRTIQICMASSTEPIPVLAEGPLSIYSEAGWLVVRP